MAKWPRATHCLLLLDPAPRCFSREEGVFFVVCSKLFVSKNRESTEKLGVQGFFIAGVVRVMTSYGKERGFYILDAR